tara:strand:+ start:666 stop:851 length:186 start_codon:yes stop_codon:yes gene_type:complete
MRVTKHYCDACGKEAHTEQLKLITEREYRSTEGSQPWVDFCEKCAGAEKMRWQQLQEKRNK